jgi:NAD(P)-dependent dehydrogenase (short-subunit alcohol dehydrogenase family)
MTLRLASKVVIVTGGATGIGRAVGGRVASEGGAVVIAGRRAEPGERAAAEIAARGGRPRFVATDVTVEGQVERLVPTGRVASAAEIAAFAAYLLSGESAFSTGAALPVDGGATDQ